MLTHFQQLRHYQNIYKLTGITSIQMMIYLAIHRAQAMAMPLQAAMSLEQISLLLILIPPCPLGVSCAIEHSLKSAFICKCVFLKHGQSGAQAMLTASVLPCPLKIS